MNKDFAEKALGITQFHSYIQSHSSESRNSKVNENYYHVNVVAEAWGQGYSEGEKSAKQAFAEKILKKSSERFLERATEVYVTAKSMVSFLMAHQYKAEKIYLNIFHRNPEVILSFDKNLLLDDDFVVLAYSKIHDMQKHFHSLFQSTLDLSLISTENLDEKLLAEDGFDYSENL